MSMNIFNKGKKTRVIWGAKAPEIEIPANFDAPKRAWMKRARMAYRDRHNHWEVFIEQWDSMGGWYLHGQIYTFKSKRKAEKKLRELTERSNQWNNTGDILEEMVKLMGYKV